MSGIVKRNRRSSSSRNSVFLRKGPRWVYQHTKSYRQFYWYMRDNPHWLSSKGENIQLRIFTNLLDRWNKILKKHRTHLAKENVFFHQNNARGQSFFVALAKFNELGFKVVPYPPYCPDLTPSDFLPFLSGSADRDDIIVETKA